MRWLRGPSYGFSLVEVVIVLAITVLMVGGVVVGRNALLQNTSFTASLDDAKNLFRQIQNEANQGLSINTTSTAGQSTEQVFGKLVKLLPDSGTLATYTLVEATDSSGHAALAACDEQDDILQDSIIYDGTSTQWITFTRNTDSTQSSGQIFVAPNGAGLPPIGTSGQTVTAVPAPAVNCPSGGAGLPAATAPASGIASACGIGQQDTRTTATGATDTCVSITPPAPTDLKADDGQGNTADSNNAPPGNAMTTSTATVTLTATLPVQSGATSSNEAIQVWVNGAATSTYLSPTSATSATGTYTFSATGTYSVTVKWLFGGSMYSAASAPVTVKYIVINTCTLSAPTYQCGLAGTYYRGDQFDTTGQTPQSIFIDKQVGCDLDNGNDTAPNCTGPLNSGDASAYGNFLPTLRTRTVQADAQFASVTWTGQIYIAPNGNHPICIASDDTGTLDISGQGYVSEDIPNGDSPACMGLNGGPNGEWSDITITYVNSWSFDEGSAYIRLYDGTTNEDINGSLLRVASDTATQDPGPDPQGLGVTYYHQPPGGIYQQNGAVGLVNGVGTNSTPATSPDWLPSLESLAGADPANEHLEAIWVGYLWIPHDGDYQFCAGNDDAGFLLLFTPEDEPDFESTTAADFDSYATNPPADVTNCGDAISLTTGQYPIEMNNQELSYFDEPNNHTNFNVTIQEVSDDPSTPPSTLYNNGNATQIPLNWFSWYQTYSRTGENLSLGLPSYQQYVSAIVQHARELSTPVATAKATRPTTPTVWQRVGRALAPSTTAYAASNCSVDTNNILDPLNYTNDCSAYTNSGSAISIPVEVNGDTSHQGSLQFDPNTNTIGWSIP